MSPRFFVCGSESPSLPEQWVFAQRMAAPGVRNAQARDVTVGKDHREGPALAGDAIRSAEQPVAGVVGIEAVHADHDTTALREGDRGTGWRTRWHKHVRRGCADRRGDERRL